MALGALGRARAAMEGLALRMVLGPGWLRRALAARRSDPVEGQILDEHLAAMLRLDDFTHDSVLLGSKPPRARRRVVRSVAIVDAPCADPMQTRELRWRGPAGESAARLYVPNGLAERSEALLYIHGGGWVTGDIDTHDPLCRKLAARANVRVISIDYRLAPEHPFPAAVDDAVAAFRWTVDHAAELGIHPARIAVGGDSAGGNLSAVVGLRCASDAVRPALTLLLYPALDATLAQPSHATFGDRWFLTRPMIDWYYDHYTGGREKLAQHADLSPLLAPSVEQAPPALLYPAHFDPLRDEAVRYAERLARSNVAVKLHCWPTFIHGFALMTRASPAAAAAVDRIGEELGAALRHGVSRSQIGC